MTIIVNPHSLREEQEILAFLDSMNYEYITENNVTTLSEIQLLEILDRDRQYEAGEIKSYSLDEVIAHFNIGGK